MSEVMFALLGTILIAVLISIFINLEFKLFKKVDAYRTTKEYLFCAATIMLGLAIITGVAVFWFQYLPVAICI